MPPSWICNPSLDSLHTSRPGTDVFQEFFGIMYSLKKWRFYPWKSVCEFLSGSIKASPNSCNKVCVDMRWEMSQHMIGMQQPMPVLLSRPVTISHRDLHPRNYAVVKKNLAPDSGIQSSNDSKPFKTCLILRFCSRAVLLLSWEKRLREHEMPLNCRTEFVALFLLCFPKYVFAKCRGSVCKMETGGLFHFGKGFHRGTQWKQDIIESNDADKCQAAYRPL